MYKVICLFRDVYERFRCLSHVSVCHTRGTVRWGHSNKKGAEVCCSKVTRCVLLRNANVSSPNVTVSHGRSVYLSRSDVYKWRVAVCFRSGCSRSRSDVDDRGGVSGSGPGRFSSWSRDERAAAQCFSGLWSISGPHHLYTILIIQIASFQIRTTARAQDRHSHTDISDIFIAFRAANLFFLSAPCQDKQIHGTSRRTMPKKFIM